MLQKLVLLHLSMITLTLKPISNITYSQQALISLKYCTGEKIVLILVFWTVTSRIQEPVIIAPASVTLLYFM
jgi:hypothetical protein